jgi:potassium efflux system protein
VVLAGVITISNLLGLDWAKIQWIAAAFSLGIAFGLQELFANFISGLIILFERPIRIGDIISVGEVTGTVTRINIRATTITDPDRRDFLIPNKNFITGNVLNWTLSDPLTRVTLPVGVAYGSDTALVEKLLLEAARENPHVMNDPSPMAVLSEFGDNTLNFKLFVFIPDRSLYQEMLHRLTTTIDKKFRKAEINIAFPQRDVHLHAAAPIEVRLISRSGAADATGLTA